MFASLFAWFSPVLAAKPNYAPEFPENSGIYDMPGYPNLKVRIFVHKAKPAKPGSGPTPISGTCSLDGNINDYIGSAGWHLPSKFTYNLNPTSVPGYVSGLSTIAQNAFGVWTSAISGKVSLTAGPITDVTRASYDGQNIIAWGRTSGSALAVTYTWYDRYTKEALQVDTIMNKKFFWTSGGCFANSYDAQDILTHELGHWFGLNDYYESNYIDNTMYGYGSKSETKKSTLTDGDIAGINAIY